MIWDKVEDWEIDGTEIIFYDGEENEITRANIDSIIEVYIERMKKLEV